MLARRTSETCLAGKAEGQSQYTVTFRLMLSRPRDSVSGTGTKVVSLVGSYQFAYLGRMG